MKRLSLVLVAVLATMSGCGPAGRDGPDTPTAAVGAPATTGSAVSLLGSVKDEGDIPDPCTLLGKDEVLSLTGREITRVDGDGAPLGDTTRFCQWQQDGGQLALFLSRTTATDFRTVIGGATPVGGLGADAFQLAGHLYVLYGTVQVDVYSRGGSDEENLADASEVAKVVIPRI